MAEPYRQTIEQVFPTLDVDPERGLSAGEAKRRLEEHGETRLREAKSKSTWAILADPFKSLIIGILFLATVLSATIAERGPEPLDDAGRKAWIKRNNIARDVFPALSLGVGETREDVMKRPPRDPYERILTRDHWVAIAAYGTVIGGPFSRSSGTPSS